MSGRRFTNHNFSTESNGERYYHYQVTIAFLYFDMGKFKDLTGQKFNGVTILENSGKNKQGQYLWKCECGCGNIFIVSGSSIVSGHTKSYGHCHNPIHEIGNKYGRLTIIEFIGRKDNKLIYKCQCECGDIRDYKLDNLKNGHTKSCGCYAREQRRKYHIKHGQRHTRIYRVWSKLKERCYNPNCEKYEYYGGRGIKVCDEWLGEKGFMNFYEWAMTNGYTDELTIDRINPNRSYEPSNCRWATWDEQQNNRRSNRIVTYNGVSYTAAELARKFNISYKLFMGRLYRGYTIDEAIKGKRGIK